MFESRVTLKTLHAGEHDTSLETVFDLLQKQPEKTIISEGWDCDKIWLEVEIPLD